LINEALLPEYDREMAVTRTTLERCPEEKFGWKPQPKSFAMAALATHIAKVSDQHLMQTWTLLAGGQAIFSMPRAAVLRGMIMNHIIHHRAQLGVYLRLNDIPVPATYGPSADEQG
jgi:uncharacterized damage-inducible protein DinB